MASGWDVLDLASRCLHTGITGDISEVQWDNGYKGDYRTGFEGTYRLCLDPEEDEVNQRINIGALDDEQVVGLDVEPLERSPVFWHYGSRPGWPCG